MLLGAYSPVLAQTSTPPPDVPPGFFQVDSDLGVWLYRKDYPAGNPDYVQVIDLAEGARLKLMHGELKELREKKGVYGGADPKMTSLPIQTYWQQVSAQEKEAFCATNGQFFYMPEYPTRLAFPLKVDGVVVTDGWGIDTYVDQKLMLELWDDHADIVELSQETLYGSSAPNAIGGLTEEANKRSKFSVGRTFVGVDDRDGDGSSETILVFNTLSAKQSGAAETLRSFGADEVMMLDGGGSTQLLCRDGFLIRSDRPVPQAIAVIAATEPPVASEVISSPDWPVILEGEKLPVVIEIENTGVLSWTPETTSFVIQTGRLELQQNQPTQSETMPGETATLSQTVTIAERSGVIPVEVRLGIAYQEKLYSRKTLKFQTIVLPYQLKDRKTEISGLVKEWSLENPQSIEARAKEWIQDQMRSPIVDLGLEGVNEVRAADATLVPLLMLPAMALIAWIIARTRQ
jgi:hypothetical protein